MSAHIVAKKRWGQHFLHDKNIAQKIVASISESPRTLIEVGPGTGILTGLLLKQYADIYLIEIDETLVDHLLRTYDGLRKEQIIVEDVLQVALDKITVEPLTLVGNLPYNISSQIFFKVLKHRHQVQEVVAMIQHEVAERLVAAPGSKTYGMLSVLLQAFYDLEYLFKVGPQCFSPPPQVQSAVIRLRRNSMQQLDCDEQLFFRVVKAAFQQRRKTLRNALKPLLPSNVAIPFLGQRAEQLSGEDFVALTKALQRS